MESNNSQGEKSKGPKSVSFSSESEDNLQPLRRSLDLHREPKEEQPPRRSLDLRRETKEEKPRRSLDILRPFFSSNRAKSGSNWPSFKSSDSFSSGPKILITALPNHLMLKIFSFLGARDLEATWLVNVNFNSLTREIVRIRWSSLLPRSQIPRMTLLNSPTSRHIKDTGLKLEGEHLKVSSPVWKSLATQLSRHNLNRHHHDQSSYQEMTQNPSKLTPTLVDAIQIPLGIGNISSVTSADPLPLLIVGTTKGYILVYSAPTDRTSIDLNLVASLETGLQDMKLAAGNGRIFATSKHSCLVSVWDIETLKAVSTIGMKTDAKGLLTSIDYEKNTNQIATGDHWGSCNIWDARSNKHIFEGISNHTMAVEDVRIENNSIVVANGMITLYNLSKAKIVRRDGDGDHHYTHCVVSDHNKYFIGATKKGPINLFSFETSQQPTPVPFSTAPIHSLSLLHDFLYTADCTGSNFLFEVPFTPMLKWRVKPLDILNHTPSNCITHFNHLFLTSVSSNVIKTWNYFLEEHEKAPTIPFQATNNQNCLIQ